MNFAVAIFKQQRLVVAINKRKIVNLSFATRVRPITYIAARPLLKIDGYRRGGLLLTTITW